MSLKVEEVLLEFGELAGANEGFAVDDERRQDLGVAVAAGMDVQHEVDERPLEQGAGAEVDGEAGAGELGAALEVEDAELGPQVPVGLGREIEVPRDAHRPLATVVRLVPADGNRGVRQIG